MRKHVSRNVIPSEVEGSFSLAARRRVSEKEKWETPYRGRAVLLLKGLAKEGERGERKRFLAALEMTVWGMDIPCIIQRMCEKARFPYRHPERSRGIFFVGGQTESAEKEKRETPYRRKGGRAVLLLEGLAKEAGKGGRKRFLAALEMTAWGMGYAADSVGNGYPDDSVENGYPVHHTKNT